MALTPHFISSWTKIFTGRMVGRLILIPGRDEWRFNWKPSCLRRETAVSLFRILFVFVFCFLVSRSFCQYSQSTGDAIAVPPPRDSVIGVLVRAVVSVNKEYGV